VVAVCLFHNSYSSVHYTVENQAEERCIFQWKCILRCKQRINTKLKIIYTSLSCYKLLLQRQGNAGGFFVQCSINCLLFNCTAFHATRYLRSCSHLSICLPVHYLWRNEWNLCPNSYAIRNIDAPSYLTGRMVSGRQLLPEILGQIDPPPFKNVNF